MREAPGPESAPEEPSHVPRLVEAGRLTEAERRAFETEWRERELDPGAFLSAPPMVGIIAEKR